MTDKLAVEAVGLVKRFGAVEVLSGVDLQVRAGQILALLGPNGAGKTTTVRILATLTRPDGGTAHVAGADVVREQHAVRRRIAVTGQYAALDEEQTGRENLVMMGRLARLGSATARTPANALLERFDLGDAADRRVATYSGGMRRRLDLAASLVAAPEVIFLDEPTTGLDPHSRSEVWRAVVELARGGTTVLLTTQYLEEADRLADRVAVLNGGRIVASGTPDELKRRVRGSRIDMTAADPTGYDVLVRRLGGRASRHDASALTVSAPAADDAAAIRELLDELDPDRTSIAQFALHRPSLDDVFLGLTRSDKELSHV